MCRQALVISSPNIEAYNDSQSQPIIRSHDNCYILWIDMCQNVRMLSVAALQRYRKRSCTQTNFFYLYNPHSLYYNYYEEELVANHIFIQNSSPLTKPLKPP